MVEVGRAPGWRLVTSGATRNLYLATSKASHEKGGPALRPATQSADPTALYRFETGGRRLGSRGVADEAELDQAVERSAERAELVRSVEGVEEDLRKATGLTLSEVEEDASGLAGSEIDPEIEELDREIEALDAKIKDQGRAVGELENRRSLVDTAGRAAEAMARAQRSLTDVARHAEEYVQVLLAKWGGVVGWARPSTDGGFGVRPRGCGGKRDPGPEPALAVELLMSPS